MAKVKAGDSVSWKSHGGTAHGTVEKKLTGDIKIKGQQIRASEDDPKFLVRTDKGAKAAHKAEALKKG